MPVLATPPHINQLINQQTMTITLWPFSIKIEETVLFTLLMSTAALSLLYFCSVLSLEHGDRWERAWQSCKDAPNYEMCLSDLHN